MSIKQTHLLFLLFLYSFLSPLIVTATAKVVLICHNLTLSFDAIEANFAPAVKGSGECGVLYTSEPIDACSPLTNQFDPAAESAYALVIRGGCTFQDKVKRVESAGFKAAIVYDHDYNEPLVAMAGSSSGIKIHAVFVSRASGEKLKEHAGCTDMELWIIPGYENSAWSIMAISFISLLAISAVLATCFFVRRHRIRRGLPRASHVREFHGMSSRLVKAMPSLIFTAVLEDNTTSRTCAICLEDYSVGEKLRVLPCRHKFHAACVDSWLTTWRTFCPVCKRDARTNTGDPPVSECTPLLSSGSASLSSATSFSSIQPSLAASSVIQIAPAYYGSPSLSHNHSLSSTPYAPQSRRSYSNLHASSLSSSVDLRSASFQRSYASFSLGYPSLSSFNSRYVSPYIPTSSNASPSNVGSSSRRHEPCLLHCSESAGSLSSPFASALSLSGC